MKIWGHAIKRNCIIGIGPLMMGKMGGQTEEALYNHRQLSFLLHTQNVSILIVSPVYQLDGHADEQARKEQHSLGEEARAEYFQCRAFVFRVIGEQADPPVKPESKIIQLGTNN